MLRITRNVGEAIVIGDDVEVALRDVSGQHIVLEVVSKHFPGETFHFPMNPSDSVVLSNTMSVYHLGLDRHGVELGIRAPRSVLILRKEIVGRGIIPKAEC